MDNLHMSVIAVVLYFNLPGSVGTKSQWILLDTHHHSDCRWDGELSVNCSFTGISIVPEDVSQTVITADFSYNNIKTFMRTEGRNEEWVLKHLNLSNNLISELSLTAFRNLPVLETLNLNGNAIHTLTLDVPTPAHGSKNYGKGSCLLPALKVLSVERNNLNTVPRGLGLLQSLQTVHLSSNGIHQIDLNDFQNCSQLKDIDLKKNKITKIHPYAFRDLNKLQFVDLRENALTTPLPQILMSLNFFRLEVDLSNNAWIFNCRLNAFKHLFHFLFNSTRKKWSISYNKSANKSQKPLMYLSSSHLNCSNSVLLKRAVIPTGKTSVLNCDSRGNGVSWWTPKGRISKDNSLPHMTVDKMNNLVIYNAEKTSEGLYLCICNTTKTYLIYNIQVKERASTFLVRKARDTNTAFRKGRTEQDFVLAVCLSVLITFVCAFCLGAFARPYLGSLCRLLHRKKNPDSEHSYSNQAFSDETLSRECSASKPTNTQSNLFICDEKSSRSTCIFPIETSTLHENVIDSSVHAPNTKEEYQKQGNNKVNGKKKTVPSDIKTSTSSDENIHVDDNGLFSVRRDSPEIKGIVSQNEPISITKFMPGRQSCDEQLGLNGNINATSDVGDFILPSSCKREKNIENLSVHQTIENSALTEYNCKMEHTNEKDTSADIFGNSSDEGSLFTMSDCSSLADFELEQPAVSDNLPVCQLSQEQADMNSETKQLLTLPEPPNIAAELKHIGKNEDKNNACFETTINCGSDTIMPETASAYTDKCSNRVSMSDSDAISSSSQEAPAMFDYFTNEESTVQNSISDSLHNQNTDFGNTFLSLNLFPTYDTENTPEEGELQLYQFPIETQYSPRFSPTEQKENEPEGNTDKCIDRNSSEKNHGEGNITLRRNTSTSKDNFTFAPVDTGLNEIVKKPSLLHSSNESPLQLLPEHATEKHFTVIPEKEDLPPEGKQVNTTKVCADKMQRGFNEKNWEGYIEVQDASNCSLPKETQTFNATAALLLLHSSGKTQPAFSTEDCFQLDQSDEDAYSLSVPQGFFSESTQYSSHSFPQKTTGNIISKSTNSKMEDDTTLTGLENNFTTAANNQNSSEKLSQKHQTNLGQGQFFVKKKRAFDGFANVLQSRRTNFNS